MDAQYPCTWYCNLRYVQEIGIGNSENGLDMGKDATNA